jgi:D-alanyl-D-alanine carboxypeptidase
MPKAHRFGSAISVLALASMIGGCAAPHDRVSSASGFGGKTGGEIGLATQAMAALNSNNIPSAINFAERAVAKTPNDAGFRALLGSTYFAGGRFRSAEAAYKDSLSIYSNQPQVVLKLALVEIALGKSNEAIAFLDAARDVIDPADYGLAVALAGRPADAIPVLDAAARAPGADARVRQNLALAFALSGDWTNARTVAAQDVPADQLDGRIRQWMQLATPGHASDQIAALMGVTPMAADPGQPVQLALNKSDARQAQAAPVPAPAPAPAVVAQAPVVEAVAPAPPPQREVAAAKVPQQKPAPVSVAMASAAAPEAPSAFAAFVPKVAPPKAKPIRASAAAKPAPVRQAVLRRGNSTAVVQLGAYGNPRSVLAAWTVSSRRYAALKTYAPMSARFASPRGTFYRLSVRGFGSVNEASALCASLRRAGGSCFVRNVAGDAPVQFASR